MTSPLGSHWSLDPTLAFLNHGSFGACPATVLAEQSRLRAELERQPVEFFMRRLPDLLDRARAELATFVGADPEGMVAVPNATTGVNSVLRSLALSAGDELLVTDHAYNACRNALDFVAERTGARVVVAALPFPGVTPAEVVERLQAAVGRRTRLALIDHVTSPTGLVLPVAEITAALRSSGVEVLIDGAHAPGMVEVEVDRIGCDYYTGNCHKWLCAPKGAAFLWVRPDRRRTVRPLTISHGANTPRPGRSRLHDEFDWTGTDDPTAFLCVPTAIEVMSSMVDGGWDEIRRRNRRLALAARDLLLEVLDCEPPCPDEMIGSLASLPLPDGEVGSVLTTSPLQAALLHEHRIEVPVMPWPRPPGRILRISAQLYNEPAQYRRLADALRSLLARSPGD